MDIIRLADLAMLLMQSGTLSSETGVKLLLFVFCPPSPQKLETSSVDLMKLDISRNSSRNYINEGLSFFPSGFQYNLSLEDILWNPHAVRAELESRFSFDDLHVKKLLSYTAQFTKVNNLNKCFSFLCFYFLVAIPEGIFSCLTETIIVYLKGRQKHDLFYQKAKDLVECYQPSFQLESNFFKLYSAGICTTICG